ncbi:MAG TPA: RidA family protein [Gaiellaceae bacterium]|nr:RidA family protein [Gaiellaceae bacterium]
MERRLVPTRSPYAALAGYSRAVRVGEHVYVAGTAPIMEDDADPPGDAYGQAKRCFEIIVAALAEVDAGPKDVVRTRVYLTDGAHWEGAGRAHGELFADVRPANTTVVVGALLDPRWLMEIEVEAVVAEGR